MPLRETPLRQAQGRQGRKDGERMEPSTVSWKSERWTLFDPDRLKVRKDNHTTAWSDVRPGEKCILLGYRRPDGVVQVNEIRLGDQTATPMWPENKLEARKGVFVDSHPDWERMPNLLRHSHSIVDGGLLLMSKHTRLTPRTSLMMRLLKRWSRSCGNRTQSAVIPSWLSTARTAMT